MTRAASLASRVLSDSVRSEAEKTRTRIASRLAVTGGSGIGGKIGVFGRYNASDQADSLLLPGGRFPPRRKSSKYRATEGARHATDVSNDSGAAHRLAATAIARLAPDTDRAAPAGAGRRQDQARPGSDAESLVAGCPVRHCARPEYLADAIRRPYPGNRIRLHRPCPGLPDRRRGGPQPATRSAVHCGFLSRLSGGTALARDRRPHLAAPARDGRDGSLHRRSR